MRVAAVAVLTVSAMEARSSWSRRASPRLAGRRQEQEAEERPHDEQHEERAEAGQRQAGPGERCAVR